MRLLLLFWGFSEIESKGIVELGTPSAKRLRGEQEDDVIDSNDGKDCDCTSAISNGIL